MRGVVELAEMYNVNASTLEHFDESWRFGYWLSGKNDFHDELIVKMTRHGFISGKRSITVVVGVFFYFLQCFRRFSFIEQHEEIQSLLCSGGALNQGTNLRSPYNA